MATALPDLPEDADFYELLGVARTATPEELKVAYRRRALVYHPDRHGEEDRERADDIFKRIASAYRVLNDDEERRRYDAALSRGHAYHEAGATVSTATLAEILEDILEYEHIFASQDELRKLDSELREIVQPRLVDELHEQIVGIWTMAAAPPSVEHRGTYNAGAIIVTNLRVLLPFRYSWEETRGNTRYSCSGASVPAYALPFITRIVVVSERRVRNTLWVEMHHEEGVARFRSPHCDLGKLLLVARLWGIPLGTREVDARGEELQWALVTPWRHVAMLVAAVVVVAAGIGLLWGDWWYTPVDFAASCSRVGVLQWAVVFLGALSASRLWRWTLAYDVDPLFAAAKGNAPPTSTDVVPAPTTVAG